MAYKKRDELLNELEVAYQRIQELEKELSELKGVQKIKNERNAGRHNKFSDDEIKTIEMLRIAGKSYRTIAKEMNCSVGLVHKLLNEHFKDNDK